MPEAEGTRAGPLVGRRQELASLDAALDGLRSTGARWLVLDGEPGTGKTRLLAELGARARGARAPRAGRARLGARAGAAVRRLGRGARRPRGRAGPRPRRGARRGSRRRARPRAAVRRRGRRRGARRAPGRALPRPPRGARAARRAGGAHAGGHRPRRHPLGRRGVARADRPPAAAARAGADPDRARVPRGPAARLGARRARGVRAREQRQRAAVDAAVRRRGGRAHGRAGAGRGPRGGLPPERRQPVLPARAGPRSRSGRRAVRRRGRGRRARLGVGRARAGDRGPGRARAAAGLGRGRRGGSGGPRPRHRRRRARARSRRWRRWRSWWSATCCGRPTVPRRYAFRHPIVRRAVYEAAGEAWRLGAHARAAAALAERPSAIAARAHHVERSARVGDEAAAAILEQAAHQAAARAPAVAARWLSAALRLLPDPPDGSAERRLGMLVPLATALAASGRLEEALDTLLQTLEQIPPEHADLRVRLVAACASCENALGRHDAAHARLLHALAEFPDDGSAGGAALQVELAADALYDSDFAAMRQWGERAAQTAEALGDPGLLAVAQALVCFAEYALGGAAQAEPARVASAAGLDALPDELLAAAARPAVLPRLRRVLLRALRGCGTTPAARHRARARGRSGPVRRADDGRAGAGARAPRPPARGAEHRGGGGRGQPPERQPAGRGVRARRRGVDGRGAGRRRPRPLRPPTRRWRCSTPSTRACSRGRRTPTSA